MADNGPLVIFRFLNLVFRGGVGLRPMALEPVLMESCLRQLIPRKRNRDCVFDRGMVGFGLGRVVWE